MKGQTHLAVGLGIGVIASFNQPAAFIPIVMITSGVASLAPDLDGNNLLNKRVTKTAKQFRKFGLITALVLMIFSVVSLFLENNSLPLLNESWFTLQNKLLMFVLGAIILSFALRKLETLKNILMSLIGLVLIYYAASNELWWLVMFGLYIGGAGWFSHRGATHTIWVFIYWGVMSYLLEESTGIKGLTLISSLSYLSHIVGDMLTKRGVKFMVPMTNKVFRIKI
ncbi:metal-dependent hydrolase [Bacillus benzoevorans]|uniref:Inner membrane protein n=1 Tax=Bacillus benzoevorans TaxID=1456 RepID=A0A7X0HVT5_9BACI|nr:inner membrane protein [Bacillus benzoevorans]